MEKQPLREERERCYPRNSKTKVVCELIPLSLASVAFVVDIIINIFAARGDVRRFGFQNRTGDLFQTQVTPAGYVFSIWGLIYAWQAVWLLYGWTFVCPCRPSMRRPIFWGVYVAFVFVCALNIAWLYTWGNVLAQVALAFILLLLFLLYGTVGMLSYHLYRSTPDLEKEGLRCDLWLTRIVVLNGLALYASWVTIASCLNIGIVVQYYSPQPAPATVEALGSGSGGGQGMSTALETNAGTVILALLAVVVLVYFVLENTVLDRFTRFVVTFYPTVIWALIGVLVQHWNKEEDNRNNIFTAVLLGVVILLGCVRVVLLILFAFVRPLKYSQHEKLEYV